jgi:hypothetical protein
MGQFAQETAVERQSELLHGETWSGKPRPAPGPLQARFYSRHMTSGVIEEDGEFWDSEGQLVCICRQTAKIRLG